MTDDNTDTTDNTGIDPNDLTDDQLRRLADSPLARLVMACDNMVETTEELRENPLMWDHLMSEVTRNNGGRVSSRESTEQVVTAFLDQLHHYGSLGTPEEDDA